MITASQVNELRQMTGAGMMACKKALEEANGDKDKAVEILRKSGEAKAVKRAGNETSEGKIYIHTKGNKGMIIPIMCETDFVSRTDDFQNISKEIAEKIANGEDVSSLLPEIISKVGENVKLGEIKEIEGSVLGKYIHSNDKIGVIVSLEGGDEELGRKIAMHIAAMKPLWLSPSDAPSELLEKEKPIWLEKVKDKPANIQENILNGQESKWRNENSLLKQEFVIEPGTTVEDYAKKENAIVKGFVMYII